MPDHPQDCALDLAGERCRLLPERALAWPDARTLFVADVHLGKAATLRRHGLALPGGGTSADLARLTRALERSGAARLVILGDLFHARAGRLAPRTVAAVRDWRARWAALEIVLVRGNHDRLAGDPSPDLGITAHAAPRQLGPFALLHEPDGDRPAGTRHALAGHLHPAVRLLGPGRQRLRLPCFHVGATLTVLPAFGGFTGGALVAPAAGDRIYVIAEDAVCPVGAA